jgi:glycosyltransferase involved in cell wall biosynthesis
VSYRPRLSACVIVRNEQARLAACLERLTWADELVVVDDASTDDTLAVARKFTPRVVVRDLAGDYAGQRNFALTQAGGDWVLFVDADEHVEPPLREEIRAAIEDRAIAGYAVRRQDVNFGQVLRFGESMQVPLLRLARRGAGQWVGRVHEVWKIQGPTRVLTQPLLHYSHADIAAFLRKVDAQSTLAARRLLEEGRAGGPWQLLAYPAASFFRNYVVRQGFRDGVPGLVYALLMTLHPFLARAKAWERRRGTPPP